MSYYEDERQRRRPTREATRRDDYDDDAYYNQRGQNRTTTLIKRRDSYDDVDEEITREFSPPGGGRGGYIRETTVRRSGVRPARARSFDDDRYMDDRYDDTPYGRRGDQSRYDRRDRSRRRRYSSDHSSRSRTPPRKDRRKSKVEETLEALGLGGLIGGILGKESKDRSSSRDRNRSRSRSGRDRAYSEDRSDRRRSRSRGGPSREQVTQAIKAALLAGAGEAFRARKEPGGLTGEKGKRIITAAFSAGGVDSLINHGKDREDHGIRNTVGSAIAGMATSRIVNGPRSQSRGRHGSVSPDGRGRGRSSSRGGVKDLLAGGAVAAAAKKAYDNVRSRSRGRSESRSRYSDTSRSPSRSKSRRRSVSRAAARGLAAVGLSGAADKINPDRERDQRGPRRRNSDVYDDRSSYYEDHRDVGQPRDINRRARDSSQSSSDQQDDQNRGLTSGRYSLDFGPRRTGDPDTDSDSDLGSSSGEEKERKKGKRKLLLTSGLAGIATIHAGHGVYQSYESHQNRKKAVREGKISAEQAQKNQKKDRMNDLASLGIAAIGVKGAFSEWKEMHEHRKGWVEEQEKLKRHAAKREARRLKYERLKKQGLLDSVYSSSMPDLQSSLTNPPPGGWHQPFNQQPYYDSQGRYVQGGPSTGAPQYYDDNPYGGSYFAHPTGQIAESPLPPPPVGPDHYHQPRGQRERSPSRGRPQRQFA